MKVSIISFSRAGYRLSEMLYWVMKERGYEVESYTKSKYTKKVMDESQLEVDDRSFRNVKQFAKPVDASIKEWAGMRFRDSDAIVFVGACGIACAQHCPLCDQ